MASTVEPVIPLDTSAVAKDIREVVVAGEDGEVTMIISVAEAGITEEALMTGVGEVSRTEVAWTESPGTITRETERGSLRT